MAAAAGRAPGRIWHVARRVARASVLVLLEVATTVRVVATMIVVEVLVRTVPLERVGALLGCRVDLSPSAAPAGSAEIVDRTQLSRRTLRRLRCTHRIARAWPFSDGPCLRRSLVGGHLLRDLDPSIRLGLIGHGDDLTGHAWLELHGQPLEDVTLLSRFDHQPHRRAS